MRPISRFERIGLALAAITLLAASVWLRPNNQSGALAHRQLADSASQWGLGGDWQRSQLASTKQQAPAVARTQ